MGYAWTFPDLAEGHPADPDVLASRARAKAPPRPGDDELKVTIRTHDIAGMRSYVLEPDRAATATAIVHLHGGGFRSGSASAWRDFGRRLAAETSTTVVLPEYPLAPEAPFPAALHALSGLYEHLVDDEIGVILAGDSAGGGLAASLTTSCRDAGAPMPMGLVLMSPWLDLTVTADGYLTRRDSDRLFSADSARAAAALYLQGRHSAKHPLASSLFADVLGFPPVLMFAGGAEVLLDDTLAFAAHLARAGVDVETNIVAGMQHVWPVLEPELARSDEVLQDIARFVDRVKKRHSEQPG